MSKIRRREKSSPYLWAKETLTSEQEQKLINPKNVKYFLFSLENSSSASKA
jgi:hypothetical protein